MRSEKDQLEVRLVQYRLRRLKLLYRLKIEHVEPHCVSCEFVEFLLVPGRTTRRIDQVANFCFPANQRDFARVLVTDYLFELVKCD